MTIGALAPIGTLGSYLFNCQKSSTLIRSPLRGSATTGLMTFDQFKKLAALTMIPEKDWEAQLAEMEATYEAIKVASNKPDAAGASSSNARSAPGTAKE